MSNESNVEPPRESFCEPQVVTVSLADSFAQCQRIAKKAGNFYFSFLTLSRDQFRDMCALYAFMRLTDDLGDDTTRPVEERRIALEQWKQSLHAALEQGEFYHAVLPALADVVSRRLIPHEYLFAVIKGVQMDLDCNKFNTFGDLERYCYHVAGAVGLCCIHVWGFRDERAVAAAVNCGLALQLTNILRDLGEDIVDGRVYLPQEDLDRFGYSADDLRVHLRNEEFHALMQFEVARARTYYARAEELFDYLEPAGRPILRAMLDIYEGLLTELELREYDVFSKRVSLSTWRKSWIALRSIGARFRRPTGVRRDSSSDC
jgi:phytoene synthase